jgi:ankyrin repeat protein
MPKVDEKVDRAFGAIVRGEIEVVAELLSAGLDPNAKGRDGKPLLHAAFYGGADVCKLLLESGACVDGRDAPGATALAKAAAYGRRDLVDVLLASGADVSLRNSNDTTILHCAASSKVRGRELCELFLSLGVDPDQRTKNSLWPVHFAAEFGSVEACELFAELGFGPSFIPEDSPSTYLTPFQSAIRGGNVEHAQFYMTKYGEDLTQKTRDGRPLATLSHKVQVNMHAFLRAAATVREVVGVIDASPAERVSKPRSSPAPI